MNHENGTSEIITQKGIDMIVTVAPEGWITLGYHGSTGIIVDFEEWEGFVKLVKAATVHMVELTKDST